VSGRTGGQGALALILAALVVAGGVVLDHLVGVRAAAPGPASITDSGAWLCPHGGGVGWEGRIYLANPGNDPSTVRLTALSGKSTPVVQTVTVDPGTTSEVDVPATAKEASTYVEYFGGWVAAGWMTVRQGPGGTGVGTEPCAAATDAAQWYTANGSTPKGAVADVVIMNPYGVNAIFDVVLFASDRAPVQKTDLTDVVLKPHRSMVVPIQTTLPLEAAVGSEIDVHAGRIGVAAVDSSVQHGIGAVIGATSAVSALTIPLMSGTGQRSLSLTVPGADAARFDGSSLGEAAGQPVDSLTGVAQDAQTSQAYELATSGASALKIEEQPGVGGSFVASVTSTGEGVDIAATTGAPAASRWVVLPTIAGEPSSPGLVVANPGTAATTVTLRALTANGPKDVTLDVSAGSSVSAPAGFLNAAKASAIEVSAAGGNVIAAGASESLGNKGIAGYAIALGIPVPNLP
jgi:hypothetical protein